MKKFLWDVLALAETVVAVALAYRAVLNALIIARSVVFVPNRAYFLGMLCGDFLRIVPADFLSGTQSWSFVKSWPLFLKLDECPL
jgi:hypothetical protein